MDLVKFAVSTETEQQTKMGVTSKKSPQINQIGTHTNNPEFVQELQSLNTETKTATNHCKDSKPNNLVAALEAVHSDLASLKEAFNQSQISGKEASKEDQQNLPKRKSTLCSSCKESGEGKCDHCF